MKEQIEQLLPQIKAGKLSDTEIQEQIDKIKNAIKEDSSKGKEYGELLSRIKQACITKNLPPIANWVNTGKGYLAIGHKPGGKVSYEGLKEEGANSVLTLLNENEGAELIGKQLNKVNIEWIWFPFSASNPLDGDDKVLVVNLYNKLSAMLEAGAKIYIHCSAGIHRTGMITYGFLRFLGNDKEQSIALLKRLREVTAAQVGEDRLIWGDQFANK
jgi:hypothetical protein